MTFYKQEAKLKNNECERFWDDTHKTTNFVVRLNFESIILLLLYHYRVCSLYRIQYREH